MTACLQSILITVFIMSFSQIADAQATGSKLDQVQLMKKFEGNWRGNLGHDTMIVCRNELFGTGLNCSSQLIAKGKSFNSVKQLYGYDPREDVYIMAELNESSPTLEICRTWFTSETTGELVVTYPADAPIRFRFEFITPDKIKQSAVQDNKVIIEIILSKFMLFESN